ncbi:MAG: alpha/beta hydrolase [Huintestinicola sp.]|uniref:alpha/beta hydrolase n=1 Tax=Huintestinicola sp. TaxID=2981661 RepID=UPI003F08434D
MIKEKLCIEGIPAILWGKPSEKIYIHVHGKMSRKEYAEQFAEIAETKGYQTLSFDLPEHGERTDKTYRCDVMNGIHDLNVIADYAFAGWKTAALFACSLGACFSLNAYADRQLEKCLFQSPVADMEWLVRHMMLWSGVSEKQLEEKQEIVTDIDTLRWDHYQYILSHPICRWPFPTAILYGAKDNLQPIESVRAFADKFGAKLTVSEQSEHPFMAPEDNKIVEKWLDENI